MVIENLTIEQLRKQHKDILENKAIQKLIDMKRKGENISLGDQSAKANRYALNNKEYSSHAKEILDPLLDLYNNSQNI
jgi:uncharacterized protein YktB (UPF0637 family)